MNCVRLYGHFASTQRNFVHGFAMIGPNRVRSNWRDCPSHVRFFHAGWQRSMALYSRLRKGILIRSVNIRRACIKQVEYILVHQVHRAQKVGSFYLQLCGGLYLSRIINSIVTRLLNCFRVSFGHHNRAILLSASSVPIFCWKEERIPKHELFRYCNELEAVSCLRLQTCPSSSALVSEDQCNSSEKPRKVDLSCDSHFHDDRCEDPWELFIKQENLLVWRREVPNHRGEGLYEYKVYGMYNDITAIDFLAVHVDSEFRKEWDTSAISLSVLEEEPDTNSEVIYWETQWPRMMSNRDYVYKRRFVIDQEHNVIVLVNRHTEHPSAPVKPGKQRVTEYWSIIVIKPFSNLNKPGLEFSMTYFDNPGLVFPSAFASWATATGFPDYLSKLHQATVMFADRRLEKQAFQKKIDEQEENRKRSEEKEKKEDQERQRRDSQTDSDRKRSLEDWETILGGGPVLSSTTGKSSNILTSFINKVLLMVT